MERLSGLDAGFLYLETPAVFMHTLKLVLLDRPDPGVDVRAALIDAVKGRLHRFPKLRRKLLDVPFGLHHPLWIETSEIDYARHVREATLAPPGGLRELDETAAEIASQPLDRSRPLWELWVLKGLRHEAFAVVLKIHHALADGVAAAELIRTVTTHAEEEAAADALALDGPASEVVPSEAELVRAAVRDHLRDLEALPGLIAQTSRSALTLLSPGGSAKTPLPMWDVPRTSFNGVVTRRRSLATVSLPLERALVVKRAASVTLNDVVLATVGSALRRYLLDRGELPARPLVASVPIASEKSDGQRVTGNRVSSLFTTLATDVADPWERLLSIHAVTREAKHVQDVLGPRLLASWLQYALPRPFSWVISQWSRRHFAAVAPPPVNLVVSNVHGPSERLYAAGLPLHAIYSVGPLLEGIGLNVTVWSYLNQLHFTVLACHEMVPRPHLITDALDLALAELEQRALARTSAATTMEEVTRAHAS